jgi:hypothetical protein
MHEGARKLDEALIKRAVGAVLVGKPKIFEYVMGFIKKLVVEAMEVAGIVRVHSMPMMGLDHGGNARAFASHEVNLQKTRIKTKQRLAPGFGAVSLGR